ncbi:hypothetical protein ACOMHN_051161 [Nucella lapillus]
MAVSRLNLPCGRISPVDESPLWTNLPCGRISPVDESSLWTNLPCGRISPVDESPLWTNLPCGRGLSPSTLSPLSPSLPNLHLGDGEPPPSPPACLSQGLRGNVV